MKSFFVLATFTLLSSSFTQAADLRIGRLLTKGRDCGVVDVQNGYLLQTGGEKILVLETAIQNLDYQKEIYLQNALTQNTQKANWSSSWWQYPVSAQLAGQQFGRDFIVLRDFRVGPQNSYKLNLYVKMGNQQFSCSSIVIGEK